jgi:YggT family protein
VGFIQVFAGVLVFLLWLLVFGRVLFSWFDPSGSSGVSRFLIETTEPFLAPVRRLMPQTGMLDFSGLIVLLVLGFIWRALL